MARGGRRVGAGRKRIHSKGVAHSTREVVNERIPLHVNFKYRLKIKNKEFVKILKRGIRNSRRKGLKIIHFSVQSNHVHFIIEATDNKILESGMRSLTVTLAMGINKGKVQLERFHLHVLKSLREAKNAIKYVLLNEVKHTGKKILKMDEYSSLFAIDAKAFAKKCKMTLIYSKCKWNFLDRHGCYITKRATDDLLKL